MFSINETLESLRVLTLNDSLYVDERLADHEAMRVHFKTLDDFISNGGVLPSDWTRSNG